MNRKIPLGLTVALMAIAAAITFIISTSYTMNLFNGLVADVQQRAEMYQKLEQIDAYVRAYYDGTIDEVAPWCIRFTDREPGELAEKESEKEIKRDETD